MKKNKKAIVVGASSGIGKELVKVLVENNYKVGLTGKEKDILDESRNGYLEDVEISCFDCTIDNNSEKIIELVTQLNGLDLLIFSAGIGNLNKNLGFEIENQANKLNVLAFTEIADWSYRFFEKQGYGHFVALSSVAGLFGYRFAPAYHAAKSYQISYLEGLRQKAYQSDKPIYVTDIRPGYVDTSMSKNKKRFWVLTAENAAKQIFDLIVRKKDVAYVSKKWQLVAIGLKLLPRWLRKRM
ncbi:SDR family NAD(P)-dependent oxidoreductase [Ancylomarina longa]|uniref:SDR family NAD(P)-dependent oxidoreductase n=1 Tax=Ancylomarina longa TaxID=2487017 RepID=A0A434B095_9BACT|nr:SDR family NAD(P)-dependent oxidoreductase [Ancylomarina longa]RUT80204.1 SDR family NAD(P)-dependent oxidoreductase [Ancylomarina longa]